MTENVTPARYNQTMMELTFEQVLADEAYQRALSLAAEHQDPSPALELFQEAARLVPDNPLYGLEYALALHQSGHDELALFTAGAAARQIDADFVEDADGYTLHRLGLAMSLILEDEHQALSLFEAAHAKLPDARLAVSHAISLDKCGYPEQAAAVAEKAVDAYFSDPDKELDEPQALTLAQLAQVMSTLGDDGYAHPIQAVHQALGAAPDSAEVQRIAGVVLLKTRDFAQAAEHFRRATDLAPAYDSAWGGLQYSLFAQGMFEEAVELGTQILQTWPAFSEVRFNTAAAMVNLGRPEEAEQSFIDLVADDPDDPLAHISLGLVYAAEGKATDARAEQARALELAPDDPEVLKLSKQIDELLDGGGNGGPGAKEIVALVMMMAAMQRARKKW